MSDENAGSAEAREALNATLKNALSNDGWGRSIWDVVVKGLREDYEIETDLTGLARSALCLIEMCQLGALARKGVIGKETRETVSEIIHNLVRIAVRAEKGEEVAANQLKALHKLTYPKNYDFPAHKIEELAESHSVSEHLQRGWAIRERMIRLSHVLVPKNPDSTLLNGYVALTTEPRAIQFYPHDYETAKAYINPKATLESVAVKLYLDDLLGEGIDINESQLWRDLRMLKEWEATHLDDDERNSFPIGGPWSKRTAFLPGFPIYIEDWKARYLRRKQPRKRKARGSDKKT